MRYPDAATAYFSAHKADGTVSLNQLLLMRAVDAIAPDSLQVSGSNVVAGGKIITGPTATLAEAAQVPGVRFVALVADAGLSFRVSTAPPPSRFLRSFSLSEVRSDIGPLNWRFIQGMIDLYGSRLKQSGLFTDRQISAMIGLANAGVVAIPSTPTRILGVNARHPQNLLEPAGLDAQRRSAWYKICEAFAAAYALYLKGAIEEAAEAVEEANATAEFWEAVEGVVTEIRDAPANLVVGTGKALFSAIGWKNWLLIGGVAIIAGGVAFGWWRGAGKSIAKVLTVKA